MTVASENSMLKHRNVNLNTVSLKASDCTIVRKLSSLHVTIASKNVDDGNNSIVTTIEMKDKN
jgi:hypothetical protein